MNLSTNNISFTGTYSHYLNGVETTNNNFTNEEEVLRDLYIKISDNAEKGLLTKVKQTSDTCTDSTKFYIGDTFISQKYSKDPEDDKSFNTLDITIDMKDEKDGTHFLTFTNPEDISVYIKRIENLLNQKVTNIINNLFKPKE